jgi:Transposase DDE domain
MPRHRRLNIPGAINHVITRGLNRQDIFLDDCDRNNFLGRLEKNLSLTGCRYYAWCGLPRHFSGNRPRYFHDPESLYRRHGIWGTSIRLAIGEPPFANIRSALRLDRFTLRGKRKVNVQWNLFCMIHNIKKIHRYGPGFA